MLINQVYLLFFFCYSLKSTAGTGTNHLPASMSSQMYASVKPGPLKSGEGRPEGPPSPAMLLEMISKIPRKKTLTTNAGTPKALDLKRTPCVIETNASSTRVAGSQP